MYVKYRMTANPFTLAPEATIAEALELMRSKNIRRVPVVKNGKLTGIITERKLLEVSPSPATSLSIFEINYLLAKTRIGELMTKDVITVTPETILEEAAVLMRDNDIGALPVVHQGKLAGIITETDLFDSFVEILGFRDRGSRIAIDVSNDRPGVLAQITGIVARFDISITHLVVFRNELILRINTINTTELLKALEENGYRVISEIKNK